MCDKNILEKLLLEIKHINDKHETIDACTGRKFNIFSILGIDEREIYICRIISELLSPQGAHGQKDLYLRLFIDTVLSKEINCNDSTSVTREYKTDQRRRIDIVIDTPKYIIGIETKINAGDGKEQLQDYWNSLKTQNKDFYLLYLTKLGNEASPESLGNLKKENVQNISFKDDIVKWLNSCLNHTSCTPIKEIISQLKSSIKIFTNQLGDERELEIMNLLKENQDYLRIAASLSAEVKKLSTETAKEIFEGIKDNIDCKYKDKYFKKYVRAYDKNSFEKKFPERYWVNIGYYYDTSRPKQPVIVTFQMANAKNCLPSIGYAVVTDERIKGINNYNDFENLSLAKATLASNSKENKDGFLYIEECRINNDPPPDFFNMNDSAIKLCTISDYREEFIKHCSDRMIELIEWKTRNNK